MINTNFGWNCLICGKPVTDYEPEMCCGGKECICRGQPMNPCVCSDKCSDALFDGIGKTYDERRIAAGIQLWHSNQQITGAKASGSLEN